jgi:NAD-dependent dihydropyrimidine dehydrogenase PreA subunit
MYCVLYSKRLFFGKPMFRRDRLFHATELQSNVQTKPFEGDAGMKSFSYMIVSDQCEGIGDCVPVFPVECIHWADERPILISKRKAKSGSSPTVVNAKGTRFVYIVAATCIECGACLSVCPIQGAILDEWRPELQKPPSMAQTYSEFKPEWRTQKTIMLATELLGDNPRSTLKELADALIEAGCNDDRLLEYCCSGNRLSSIQWVAELVLNRC